MLLLLFLSSLRFRNVISSYMSGADYVEAMDTSEKCTGADTAGTLNCAWIGSKEFQQHQIFCWYWHLPPGICWLWLLTIHVKRSEFFMACQNQLLLLENYSIIQFHHMPSKKNRSISGKHLSISNLCSALCSYRC